jgi:chemotaxis response regulator CheB
MQVRHGTNGNGHDIVVVGASAGGVEALSEFVAGLPADLEAAVFIVLHVHPSYASTLPELWSRRSPLRIAHAVHGEASYLDCGTAGLLSIKARAESRSSRTRPMRTRRRCRCRRSSTSTSIGRAAAGHSRSGRRIRGSAGRPVAEAPARLAHGD